MIQLNNKHHSFNVSDPDIARLGSESRFIVPVSSAEHDITAVARRVWELANITGSHIEFLGLCREATQEQELRRALITASAIANCGKVSTGTRMLFGKDLLTLIKTNIQPTDIVVCWDEQTSAFSQRTLNQLLRSDPDLSLYVLSGIEPPSRPRIAWTVQLTAWLGFIAIIVSFFILQVKISQTATDITTLLLLLTTAVEFWLITVWNNLIG